MDNVFELIIIGAGPAGLTAGLYAGRAGINTIILEQFYAGGQVLLTEVIENFPGFSKGIEAHSLIDNLTAQVKNVDVEIKQEAALEIIDDGQLKVVKTTNGRYQAKTIIITTGANPKRLGVVGEKELTSKGVSYCAVCDGALFKKKIVSVVGGGDRALEEALYLAKITGKVYLIHRRDKFRAAKIIQDRVLACKKIEIIYNSVVTEIQGKTRVEQLVLKNVSSQSVTNLKCGAVFIAVGLIPNTKFLKNLVNLDEGGFIGTNEFLATNASGIFAAGDCRKNTLKQVITACGEGAIAVNSAKLYLDTLSL